MLAWFSRANTWLQEKKYWVPPRTTTQPIVPAEHSLSFPVEVPHLIVSLYAMTSPTTRISTGTPSTLRGIPRTASWRVSTMTTGLPSGPSDVPVPTTSGLDISAGLRRSWISMARARLGLTESSFAPPRLEADGEVGCLLHPELRIAAVATRSTPASSAARMKAYLRIGNLLLGWKKRSARGRASGGASRPRGGRDGTRALLRRGPRH